MSDYLVHVSRERARLRSPLFGDDNTKVEAMEYLQKQPGIAGLKPGMESILVFLEPGADLPKILVGLENKFPALASEDKSLPEKKAMPQNFRKELLRTLFASGSLTVGLILFGFKHAHAWSGAVFTLLASNHIWERRARL